MRHRIAGDDTVGKDGSAALTQRPVVNFTGDGVTVTEDAGEVLITVPDAGGGGGVLTDQWAHWGNTSLAIPGGLVNANTRVPLTFLEDGPGGSDWVATSSIAPEQTNLAAGVVGVNDEGLYIATMTAYTTRATAMANSEIPSFGLNFNLVNDSPAYNVDVYNTGDVGLMAAQDAGATYFYTSQMQFTVYIPQDEGAAFIARAAQGQIASPDTWQYRLLLQKVV